ncbi:MAG: hypothetical protein CEE38_08490 [Planctomycetes bacterium B3_Pla]|nr:MAG: hypothetical protein CEE38_08490 [Planctomycetes bacterium B3_Pla]
MDKAEVALQKVSSNMIKTCEKCKFWTIGGAFAEGKCHRRAPLPYSMDRKDSEEKTSSKITRWPLTHKDQLCGEFKPSKNLTVPAETARDIHDRSQR